MRLVLVPILIVLQHAAQLECRSVTGGALRPPPRSPSSPSSRENLDTIIAQNRKISDLLIPLLEANLDARHDQTRHSDLLKVFPNRKAKKNHALDFLSKNKSRSRKKPVALLLTSEYSQKGKRGRSKVHTQKAILIHNGDKLSSSEEDYDVRHKKKQLVTLDEGSAEGMESNSLEESHESSELSHEAKNKEKNRRIDYSPVYDGLSEEAEDTEEDSHGSEEHELHYHPDKRGYSSDVNNDDATNESQVNKVHKHSIKKLPSHSNVVHVSSLPDDSSSSKSSESDVGQSNEKASKDLDRNDIHSQSNEDEKSENSAEVEETHDDYYDHENSDEDHLSHGESDEASKESTSNKHHVYKLVEDSKHTKKKNSKETSERESYEHKQKTEQKESDRNESHEYSDLVHDSSDESRHDNDSGDKSEPNSSGEGHQSSADQDGKAEQHHNVHETDEDLSEPDQSDNDSESHEDELHPHDAEYNDSKENDNHHHNNDDVSSEDEVDEHGNENYHEYEDEYEGHDTKSDVDYEETVEDLHVHSSETSEDSSSKTDNDDSHNDSTQSKEADHDDSEQHKTLSEEIAEKYAADSQYSVENDRSIAQSSEKIDLDSVEGLIEVSRENNNGETDCNHNENKTDVSNKGPLRNGPHNVRKSYKLSFKFNK